MNGWPSVRLDTIADIVRGVTYAKDDVLQTPTSEGIPILRAGNIDGRLFTDRDLVWLPRKAVSDDQLLRINDVVMCMSSGSASLVGKSAQLKAEWTGSFGAFCAAIRVNRAQANPTFVAHVLARPEFRAFAGAALGNNIKNLNKSALQAYQVPLPPLEEQRWIAAVLDRAAAIRRRADAARTQARALIPALFLDLFGDPAINPKGWPQLRLGELLLDGPQNGLYRPATDYGSGTRILRIDSFDDGAIGVQSTLKRLRIDAASVGKYALQPGDIVVNRVNSPPQLGKSALIPNLEEPTVFESNMMRLRVDHARTSAPYLAAMLQLPAVREMLRKNAKHAINQSSINQGDVCGLEVFCPPFSLQAAFAVQAARIEAVTRALDASAGKAEMLAAVLSAEVFD